MRIFRLHSEGYIDSESEFEYKHISHFREVFPLLHDHDYFEFFLIVEGAIGHFINNEKVILEKGHLVFIRPDDFHSYHKHGNQNCHFINIAILKRTINELFGYLGKGFNSKQLLDSPFPPTILLTESELSSITGKFEKLNMLPVFDKTRLNTELRVILVHLFSNYFIDDKTNSDDLPEWLNLTINELGKPANFKRGMVALKEIACKSDEHISRSFKKYLQKTPTQYVNELRLNFSANQIRFTNRKIVDIAFDSGFDNQSNFHKQFKSLFNYTPNEFRKLNHREVKTNFDINLKQNDR
jgi:AraC family cel operon transcriptional repressor